MRLRLRGSQTVKPADDGQQANGPRMVDQRTEIDSSGTLRLTPQHRAFLKRLSHLHATSGIVRRRRMVQAVAVVLTILLAALSVVGIVMKWQGPTVPALSVLTGYSAAVAGFTGGNIRLWPVWEAVIDWNRVSALANSEE